MAPRLSGFTRASSLGPIADFMDRQGGCVFRVLNDVELPIALLDRPDIVIPLREQFRFLERAARETGDDYFGARLGRVVAMKKLSTFGAWVCAAETLAQAIERAHGAIGNMLQTSTVLTCARHGEKVKWRIEFVEPETEGRHHNELLGVGYMIDTVRRFAGSRWSPDVVMTALPIGSPRAELETILGANVSHGHAVPGIEFDASLLGYASLLGCSSLMLNVALEPLASGAEPEVPAQNDELATISAVTELAMYEGYPRIDWVAAKLGTTRRSLQRRLAERGTTFNRVVDGTLMRHAKQLLAAEALPITQIALALGYADAAHFTRAFRRWTGVAPSAYRAAGAVA